MHDCWSCKWFSSVESQLPCTMLAICSLYAKKCTHVDKSWYNCKSLPKNVKFWKNLLKTHTICTCTWNDENYKKLLLFSICFKIIKHFFFNLPVVFFLLVHFSVSFTALTSKILSLENTCFECEKCLKYCATTKTAHSTNIKYSNEKYGHKPVQLTTVNINWYGF